MADLIRKGYIIYNTAQTPTDVYIESKPPPEPNQNFNLGGHCIECTENFTFIANGLQLVLGKGKHYFPPIFAFSTFHVIDNTPISSYEAIYDNSLSQVEYFIQYPIVFENLSDPLNNNKCCGLKGCLGVFDGSLCDTNYYKPRKEKYVKTITHHDLTSAWLYSHQIDKVQKDPEITQYFTGYDKYWVRQSNPPCIAVSYKRENREILERLLKDKYDIKLPDFEPVNEPIYEPTTYEEQKAEFDAYFEKIKSLEDAGIIKFVDIDS